jgi:phosphohistidine phosphatase
MLRLMLLRHAKADPSAPDTDDHARGLTRRGKHDASAMGGYIAAEMTIPSLIVCSTARRTRETCECVVAEFPDQPVIEWDEQLYLATAEAIIAVIATTQASERDLLVIGHNPGLHLAAQKLASSGNTEARTRLHKKFPTAALAVIEFDSDAWKDVRACRGRLERVVTAKEIATNG